MFKCFSAQKNRALLEGLEPTYSYSNLWVDYSPLKEPYYANFQVKNLILGYC